MPIESSDRARREFESAGPIDKTAFRQFTLVLADNRREVWDDRFDFVRTDAGRSQLNDHIGYRARKAGRLAYGTVPAQSAVNSQPMNQSRCNRVRTNPRQRNYSAATELSNSDDGVELWKTDPMPTERRAVSRCHLAPEFVGGANSCADDNQFFISLSRLQPGARALYSATTGNGGDGEQIHGRMNVHKIDRALGLDITP